jgi:hypothetical protein
MNTPESGSLPTFADWFAEVPSPEITDTNYVPDVPLELLPIIHVSERIWPRVFPGL